MSALSAFQVERLKAAIKNLGMNIGDEKLHAILEEHAGYQAIMDGSFLEVGEPWPRGAGKLIPGPPVKRPPDGWAHRYAAGAHNSTVRFGTGGREMNGEAPIERVPYWLGDDGDLADMAPIDVVAFCPVCGRQHIDAEDAPAHRSHVCSACSFEWRPADVATRGVPALKTRGQRDGAIAASVATATDYVPAVAETLLLEIMAHVHRADDRGSWRIAPGHGREFDRAVQAAYIASGELVEAVKARPLPGARA